MESLKWQLKQNASALVWKGQQRTGAPSSVRLEQMAASYNPQVYTALINLEHIKGYTGQSIPPFRDRG